MTRVMTSLTIRGCAAMALATALCMSGAASAQDNGSPFSALGRMFGQKPPAEVPQSGAQDVGQPTPDQVLRIERLEAQIRQMTGTIEQLQYRNQQLETQIRSIGGDAGSQTGSQQPSPQPMRPVTQSGSSGVPLAPPTGSTAATPLPPPTSAAATPLPPPGAPGRRSDVFDPAQHPNAPGAPRRLGTLGTASAEPPPVIMAEPGNPVGAPGGRTAGEPLDLATMASAASGGERVLAAPAGQLALPAPPSRNPNATGAVAAVAPPTDSPKDSYDLGYGYVLRKDYALAEETFHAFLKRYPSDRRVPDAKFWLGESMFQRQRYDAAAQSFLDLSTKHGSHPKAPEALLRLAQSLEAMKQKEMACATLAEVGRKYPKASVSVKQGVEREQKRVHC
jgi:tol-pal system protein YbgF